MADFSKIARFYDKMTGFENRLKNDFPILKSIIEKYNIKTALDAGCGSGVHSIILAKNNVETFAVDASKEMIELARANAARENVNIDFDISLYENIPYHWNDKYDAVFCTGNSLVGVEDGERLVKSLAAFNRVLKPGGKLIIQLLNFIKFRSENKRIIKASVEDDFTFVRFFDFDENETRLNLIALDKSNDQLKQHFFSEKILPINTDVLLYGAKATQFGSVECYSDLTLTQEYSPDDTNLVAVLTR